LSSHFPLRELFSPGKPVRRRQGRVQAARAARRADGFGTCPCSSCSAAPLGQPAWFQNLYRSPATTRRSLALRPGGGEWL